MTLEEWEAAQAAPASSHRSTQVGLERLEQKKIQRVEQFTRVCFLVSELCLHMVQGMRVRGCVQIQSDEELARQLQAQLNAEDSAVRANMEDQRNAIAESLFSHKPREVPGRGERGRGRGRRRHRS
jgi:hypothetical protein